MFSWLGRSADSLSPFRSLVFRGLQLLRVWSVGSPSRGGQHVGPVVCLSLTWGFTTLFSIQTASQLHVSGPHAKKTPSYSLGMLSTRFTALAVQSTPCPRLKALGRGADHVAPHPLLPLASLWSLQEAASCSCGASGCSCPLQGKGAHPAGSHPSRMEK